MTSGSFLNGLQGMAMWFGDLVLPALAALCIIIAIYQYSQRQNGERYITAAILCLMGPAIAQLIEAFVTKTPASGGHDQYYNGLLNAINWIGNVIMPMFAVINIVRGILTLGGFMEQFTIGDDWVRYFIVAFFCLMVSGATRLLEHFVIAGASMPVHSMLIHSVIGGAVSCLSV
jgi:hypothetical protein